MQRDLTDKQYFEALAKWEAELRKTISQATGELPDGSEVAVAERIERARNDPAWFREHYLPHLYDSPFTDEHRRLWRLQADEETLLEIAFRGWGKSTDTHYAELLRLLVLCEVEFAVLTSRTDEQTIPMVLQLRLEFECNARLRQDFGDLCFGPLWRQDHFALNDGREVMGRSLKAGSRGPRSLKNKRPDYWGLDDLQEKIDVRNPDTIAATLDYIDSTVIPALNPRRALLRVTGTRMSEDCALTKLRDERKWPTFELPAIDAQGRPTDPHRFPLEVLAKKKREMGTDAFELEFMLIATSKEGLVRRSWVKYYAADSVKGVPLVCGVFWDMAFTPGGDYKAVVSWGLHMETGDRYCLRAFIRRAASPREQAMALWEQVGLIRRNPHWALAAGYESNAAQVLGEYPLEDVRRALAAPPIALQAVHNHLPKDIRVAELVPHFENGNVHFIKGDSDQDLLVDQFVFWPKKGLDGPDATQGCWRLADALTGASSPEAFGELESAGHDGRLAEGR